MKHFKKTLKLLTVASLLLTSLLQAGIDDSAVYIKNKTKRTWIINKRVKTDRNAVLGYIEGKPKIKEYDKKIIIKPKTKKKIFDVDRAFAAGLYYGTEREKKLPFEEWGTTLVDKNNPDCTISLIVRSDQEKFPESIMGKSLTGLAAIEAGLSFLALISKKETAEKIRKTQRTLAKWTIPITIAIDLAKQTKAAFSSFIGIKYSATCNLNISDKFKLPTKGGLYKNIEITIKEEEEEED